MQELFDQPAGFTIGSTQFFAFAPPTGGVGTADPDLVFVETVENSALVGFTVSSDEFSDNSAFSYLFSVVQTDSREINGASLWLTDADNNSSMGALSVSAIECGSGAGGPGDCIPATNPRPDLMVDVVNPGIPDLIDGQLFAPSQGSGDVFRIRTEVRTSLTGSGSVELKSYAMLFHVVPEPSTAALLGLGLGGLGVFGRSRRQESRATA